jgi:hypothetical protein
VRQGKPGRRFPELDAKSVALGRRVDVGNAPRLTSTIAGIPLYLPGRLTHGLKGNALLTSLSFAGFVCSNARLDEEAFGTHCNCVARSWRV